MMHLVGLWHELFSTLWSCFLELWLCVRSISFSCYLPVFPNLNSSRPLIKLSITWRKNGVPVSSGLSDFNRRLTVLSPALGDAGYYECEAVLRSSSVPSVSAGAYLHVQGGKHTITTLEKSFWTPSAFVKNWSGSPDCLRAASSTHHLLHSLFLLHLEKHLEYKDYNCFIFFCSPLFLLLTPLFQLQSRDKDREITEILSKIPAAQNWMLEKYDSHIFSQWRSTAKFFPFVCVSQMRPNFVKH